MNASATAGSADIQRVSVLVDAAQSRYRPDVIYLKSGAPAQITFSRGTGRMATVESAQLGFYEDLTSGPRTVYLGPQRPGRYQFACDSDTVQGLIIVR